MTLDKVAVRAGTGWTIPHWRVTLLAAYVIVNLVIIAVRVRVGPENIDWRVTASLPEQLANGTLYVQTDPGRFVWSPVAAWIMWAVSYVGYWPWLALHVVVLLLLRDWRLIAFALVTWGFWVDVVQGHHMVFVAVAGVLAVRGSRPAALVYFALLFLAPRPVELPLAALLLWRDRRLIGPVLVLLAVNVGLVLGSGYADEWIAAMRLQTLDGGIVGPTAFIGMAWLVIGIPLGLWLTWKGWPGVAGLAMSHYVLGQYFLMLLVDGERLLRRNLTVQKASRARLPTRRSGLGENPHQRQV